MATLLCACNIMAPSMGAKQGICEKQYTHFPDIVKCTKEVYSSSTFARNNDPQVKLYFLKGDELSEKVQNKQITDLEARTQWQALYVQLGAQTNAESSAAISNYNAIRPRQTYCTPVGNTMNCTTY